MISEKEVKKIVKIFNKHPPIFVGNVADILEVNNIYDKKDVKKILDALTVTSPKQRGYIYEQMETRKERKLKEVI